VVNDDAQVVDWLPHARLDRAALDMVEGVRADAEAVVRYEAVRSAMDAALGAILTGFRYATRRPQTLTTPSS
jgi:glutamate dehydrogenase/leucine dehydrogenase